MPRLLKRLGWALSMARGGTAIAAASPDTGGLPPWHFQMTRQELMAFADDGPYQSFSYGEPPRA
ncbi:hypothetical protein [Dyella silvatica]|uniref:hypothetical protein n=1 Tax=Dyella silvatica TaxID=2992128 RepID=UPI0022543241|nr:hypothetical protein [Dyella silvatica]